MASLGTVVLGFFSSSLPLPPANSTYPPPPSRWIPNHNVVAKGAVLAPDVDPDKLSVKCTPSPELMQERLDSKNEQIAELERKLAAATAGAGAGVAAAAAAGTDVEVASQAAAEVSSASETSAGAGESKCGGCDGCDGAPDSQGTA